MLDDLALQLKQQIPLQINSLDKPEYFIIRSYVVYVIYTDNIYKFRSIFEMNMHQKLHVHVGKFHKEISFNYIYFPLFQLNPGKTFFIIKND